jgi:hypothetical protein
LTVGDIGAAESIEFRVSEFRRRTMATGDNESKPAIERGSYGDRGVLEQGRPDGVGKVGATIPCCRILKP